MKRPPPFARRILRWTVGVPVMVYVGLVLVMMFMEKNLVFFPTRYPRGNWQPAGLAFEDSYFTADDGTALHGWYVPHESPRAVILFAHGNGGNLSDRADILRLLHDRLRVSVMIFDYRGYGRSEGSPDEAGILQDARAARAWLAERTGVAESEIVLLGRSIGGAVMVDLAAGDGARGLVLESTFTSLPDVAAHHYPWLPVRTLMRTRLDSAAKIARYQGPLLQSHGTADEIIPYELGRRLFDEAEAPGKRFVEMPGLAHNDFPSREYYAALDSWLEQL